MMYKLLSVLSVAVMMASCAKPVDAVYLSGRFEDPQESQLILHRSSDRYHYKGWTQAIDTVLVTGAGTFAFEISIDHPDFYQVVGENGFPLFRDIYLAPGDSLHIEIPVRSDTSRITYTGAYAESYGVYDRLDSLWNADPSFQKGYYEIAKMEVDSVTNFLVDRSNRINSVIDAHFNESTEQDPIEQKCRTEYTYRVSRDYYDYLYYHNYYTQDTFVYLFPEDSYYEFLESIDLTTVPEFFTFDYMAFLSAYMRDQFQREVADLPDSAKYANRMPVMFDIAVNKLKGETRDWGFLTIASDFSQYLGRDDFFEMVDSMEQYLAANHNSPVVLEAFRKEKAEYENLRPGNPAPDFALPGVNGDTVRLSDLKGKVVYLDFWGTWCYPCLQELPSSLELEEAFSDEEVEFVYVGLQSGDDQLKQWKEFVTGQIALSYAPFLEQQVYPGIHLVADGQFNNPSLKPFKLRMAPTYMMIDKEGLIVTADAPRPSSDEIEGLLRETLSK